MKRLSKFIMVIITLLCTISPIYSQNFYLSGKINDMDKKALLGANIKISNLKQENHWDGTSTDANGNFSFLLPEGSYKIEISYIGYISYVSNVELKGNINLPPITLAEDAQLMNEVVVTARTITYNTDGYIAEVYKNPLYKDMDMTSVLKMSPGTYSTHNKVEVFGRNVSKIYLNGRELNLSGEQLINYLESIDAKNVKQMEVITSSGVEEDAMNKGKSIIKITTFNPETGGMASGGISSVNGKDKHMHTMYANVNWRINQKWGMYINANGAFGNSNKGNYTETHFYDTDSRRISEQNIKYKLNGNIRSVLGISYDLDANNLFSIEGTFNRNKNSNPSTSNVRNQTEEYLTDIANGNTDAIREYEQYNLSFIYTHKFSKDAQLNFKADRMGTTTDDNSLQRYEYIGSDNTGYDHRNQEKNLIHTARLDYTQKINALNSQFSAGAKGTWLANESNTDYATYLNNQQNNNTSYTDLYKYNENVYALYAKYAWTYKKLNMELGVRMEHTKVSPESSSNPERNYENNYTDLFPEIGLNYMIDEEKGHNITLNYNRSVTRPYMDELNPLVRRINEYSYSMGNPLLSASYYHSLTMTAILFNKYTFNMYFQTTDDGTIGLSENKNGIIYNSLQKGRKDSYLSAHVGIPFKIGKRLNVRLRFNYSYSHESYMKNKSKHHSWSTGYSVKLTLPKNFRIEHDFFYSPGIKTLYRKSSEPPTCNVSINKTLPKQGLNIGLTFLDIFNKSGDARIDSFRDDFYQTSKGTYNNFGISLRIGYNLRWGKKSMVRRASAGNSEESGRVAAE